MKRILRRKIDIRWIGFSEKMPVRLRTDAKSSRRRRKRSGGITAARFSQRVENNAFHLRLTFAWQRFADEIADEAADDDVFAELGNFGI
jgi:hypothetical protein